MTKKDARRSRGRGLGSPVGNDPDAFGEARPSSPEAGRTSRDPAEGGDLDLPGADKAARTPEEARKGRNPAG